MLGFQKMERLLSATMMEFPNENQNLPYDSGFKKICYYMYVYKFAKLYRLRTFSATYLIAFIGNI